MRITNNMMIGNLMVALQNNMNIMSKDQQVLATGKKFIEPSDDPIAMSKSMGLNTDLDQVDQYKKNCDDAVSWLNMTEDAVTKVQTVLKRAKDLSLQAANGTNADTDKKAIEEEIKQLKSELISLSNTTYAGRYLFSGFKTDQKLINDDGTYNITVSEISSDEFASSTDTINKSGTIELQKEDGTVAATVTYAAGDTWSSLLGNLNTALPGHIKATIDATSSGKNRLTIKADSTGTLVDKGGVVKNGENIEYKVGVADTITVNTLGTEIFGAGSAGLSGPPGDVPKLIKDMDSFISALDTNNIAGIQKAVGDMDGNLNIVSRSISELGAKSNRATLTSNRLDDENVNFTKLLSSNEDIDYEKVIMELTNNQSVYNASLSIGSRVIQKSLVDFLS